MNKDIKYALEYHQETKHSEVSIRSSNHYLDWDNKPKPFKFYTSLPSEALPVDFPIPSLNVITMKDTSQIPFPVDTKIDIKLLSSLLFFFLGNYEANQVSVRKLFYACCTRHWCLISN